MKNLIKISLLLVLLLVGYKAQAVTVKQTRFTKAVLSIINQKAVTTGVGIKVTLSDDAKNGLQMFVPALSNKVITLNSNGQFDRLKENDYKFSNSVSIMNLNNYPNFNTNFDIKYNNGVFYIKGLEKIPFLPLPSSDQNSIKALLNDSWLKIDKQEIEKTKNKEFLSMYNSFIENINNQDKIIKNYQENIAIITNSITGVPITRTITDNKVINVYSINLDKKLLKKGIVDNYKKFSPFATKKAVDEFSKNIDMYLANVVFKNGKLQIYEATNLPHRITFTFEYLDSKKKTTLFSVDFDAMFTDHGKAMMFVNPEKTVLFSDIYTNSLTNYQHYDTTTVPFDTKTRIEVGKKYKTADGLHTFSLNGIDNMVACSVAPCPWIYKVTIDGMSFTRATDNLEFTVMGYTIKSYGAINNRTIDVSISKQGQDLKIGKLAQCLVKSGAKFYGASWCPHCHTQKEMFGAFAKDLPYIECSTTGYPGQTQACIDAGITAYPTWKFANGIQETGQMSIEQLTEKSGCKI